MDEELKRFEAMNATDLRSLQKVFQEADVECELVPASDVMPITTLIAYLKNDAKGRLVTLNLTFLPLPEDVFPDVKLLQLYTELPFNVGPSTAARLIEMNRELPLGSFGGSEGRNVYFRHMHAMKKYDVPWEQADMLRNLVAMVGFVVDINAADIERATH
jgi:hypothetical protein